MNKKVRCLSWQILVCLILLAWLFHSIFLKEGRQAAEQQGINWQALSSSEQWRFGWHYGPIDLWHNFSMVDPLAFALAEYNAGASRAQRWAGGDEAAEVTTPEFLRKIDFPGTRKYVDSIIERYRFYQRRGQM